MVDKSQEISAMCWGNSQQTEVCIANKSQVVKVYDTEAADFVEEFDFKGGTGSIKGLAKYDNAYITCTESGLIKVWKDNEECQVEIQAGDNINRMRNNPQCPHLLATGGKENDLKIWDINRPEKPTFAAKNVRCDWLDLRVPIWVLDLRFIPDSEKVAICSGHKHVRVYDPKCGQRRPVLSMEFDEHPITAMDLVNDMQTVIGNSKGTMALVDLRKGRLVHKYKGFAGSIRSIACHPTMPWVTSCGLDRFLRIHETKSNKLLYKFYMKSRLNCVLFSKRITAETPAEIDEIDITVEKDSGRSGDSDEDVWDTLDTVGGSKPSKRKQNNTEDIDETKKNTNEKKLKQNLSV
ncbi:unnamed protein product [Owenia fusiformis]|nr:unnamed protein product [Owenia fusiformis]